VSPYSPTRISQTLKRIAERVAPWVHDHGAATSVAERHGDRLIQMGAVLAGTTLFIPLLITYLILCRI
jgi:hypothetical protein